MTTDNLQSKPENKTDDQALGFIEIIRLGVTVWLSEMKWLGYSLLRKFEISRLAKRLQEEYTRLGTVAEAPRGKKQAKELCLKQISFLKDEIKLLEDELEATRMQRVNELRSRQGEAPMSTSNSSMNHAASRGSDR